MSSLFSVELSSESHLMIKTGPTQQGIPASSYRKGSDFPLGFSTVYPITSRDLSIRHLILKTPRIPQGGLTA